jgi:osmoprotectant transport system permease protein
MNFFRFFLLHRSDIFQMTLEHLLLVAIAVFFACLIAIPLGILLTRRAYLVKPVLAIANILQTIPSLALFGFLITILHSYGIGKLPAIIALFLYSILPIVRNTYTGIIEIDPTLKEVGRAMGMTDWQLLIQVEIPLALNVILAGVRVATVISIGTATIAAAIGAGGLGTYIFRGLRMNDNDLILAGAIPATVMALLADAFFGFIGNNLKVEAISTASRRRKMVFGTATALLIIVPLALLVIGKTTAKERIIIGSKDFTEQVILSEILSQLIEARTDIPVERKFELGGDFCHRALVAGTMDAYIEYTGTAFTAILHNETITDPHEVYNRVKQQYADEFSLAVLKPLGFNNTFAILVRGEDAKKLNLKTISDLAPLSPKLQAGFGQDFMSRKDGYAGFSQTYNLKFSRPPKEMDLSLSYQALANKQVDVIAGNSTDGLINKLGLVQLEDDKHFFPPYEAVPIVRSEILRRYPQLETIINQLAGTMTDDVMRRLNYAVDAERRDMKEVAREFLATLPNP